MPRRDTLDRLGLSSRKHPDHYLYLAWLGMLTRCKSNSKQARYYHNQGVSVCSRWHDFEVFKAELLALIGPRPSSVHSLDRFPDKDGDYKPGNVRWANPTQQAQNRRSRHELELLDPKYLAQQLTGDEFSNAYFEVDPDDKDESLSYFLRRNRLGEVCL